MINYFKNLTTFRAIFLLLVAVSLGFFIYENRLSAPIDQKEPFVRKEVFDKLLESTDRFGLHLSAQESLAVALAVQFELLVPAHGNEIQIDQLLKRMVASSPEYVQGLGLTVSSSNDESNVLAFVSKRPMNEDVHPVPSGSDLSKADALTAREVNMERNLVWKLLTAQQGEDTGRFSTLLSVTMKCSDHSEKCGDALVVADLNWLADILKDLAASGAVLPMCVSPDRNIIWLENGRLHFDNSLQNGSASEKRIFTMAKKYLISGNDDGNFLKSDILGTGWRLILPNPTLTDVARPWLSFPLISLILAVTALFLEGVISSLRAPDSPRSTADGQPEPFYAVSTPMEESSGLLARIYRLLFKYRISNPEHERLESELRVAREIQFTLVPASFPVYSEWREFDLHSALYPAREVGGDYYDFFLPTPDRMVITVGDVSGKGFPAALYMAVCRTAFRALARDAANPGQLLTSLNDLLVRDSTSGRYVTIACFFVDLPTGKCEYAIAGHPAPLCFRAAKGVAEFIDTPRDTFIGLKAGLDFPVGETRLASGDTLLLYTDGVSEARNPEGEELEYDGLHGLFMEAVKEKRCNDVLASLEGSIQDFVGNAPQADDITLLAFRYWGPGGQKMPRKKGRKPMTMVFGNAAHAGNDVGTPSG